MLFSWVVLCSALFSRHEGSQGEKDLRARLVPLCIATAGNEVPTTDEMVKINDRNIVSLEGEAAIQHGGEEKSLCAVHCDTKPESVSQKREIECGLLKSLSEDSRANLASVPARLDPFSKTVSSHAQQTCPKRFFFFESGTLYSQATCFNSVGPSHTSNGGMEGPMDDVHVYEIRDLQAYHMHELGDDDDNSAGPILPERPEEPTALHSLRKGSDFCTNNRGMSSLILEDEGLSTRNWYTSSVVSERNVIIDYPRNDSASVAGLGESGTKIPAQVGLVYSPAHPKRAAWVRPGIQRLRNRVWNLGHWTQGIAKWIWTGDASFLRLTTETTPLESQLTSEQQSAVVEGSEFTELTSHSFDFAAYDSGARIIESSPSIHNVKSVQKQDVDSYLLAPCDEPIWFVLSLSTQILVRSIALFSQEFYSSTFRSVEIYGADTFPMPRWRLLALLAPRADRSKEVFDLTERCRQLGSGDCWVRYLLVKVVETFQVERYRCCTLNRLQVFGSDVLESLDSKLRTTDETQEEGDGASIRYDPAESASSPPSSMPQTEEESHGPAAHASALSRKGEQRFTMTSKELFSGEPLSLHWSAASQKKELEREASATTNGRMISLSQTTGDASSNVRKYSLPASRHTQLTVGDGKPDHSAAETCSVPSPIQTLTGNEICKVEELHWPGVQLEKCCSEAIEDVARIEDNLGKERGAPLSKNHSSGPSLLSLVDRVNALEDRARGLVNITGSLASAHRLVLNELANVMTRTRELVSERLLEFQSLRDQTVASSRAESLTVQQTLGQWALLLFRQLCSSYRFGKTTGTTAFCQGLKEQFVRVYANFSDSADLTEAAFEARFRQILLWDQWQAFLSDTLVGRLVSAGIWCACVLTKCLRASIAGFLTVWDILGVLLRGVRRILSLAVNSCRECLALHLGRTPGSSPRVSLASTEEGSIWAPLVTAPGGGVALSIGYGIVLLLILAIDVVIFGHEVVSTFMSAAGSVLRHLDSQCILHVLNFIPAALVVPLYYSTVRLAIIVVSELTLERLLLCYICYSTAKAHGTRWQQAAPLLQGIVWARKAIRSSSFRLSMALRNKSHQEASTEDSSSTKKKASLKNLAESSSAFGVKNDRRGSARWLQRRPKRRYPFDAVHTQDGANEEEAEEERRSGCRQSSFSDSECMNIWPRARSAGMAEHADHSLTRDRGWQSLQGSNGQRNRRDLAPFRSPDTPAVRENWGRDRPPIELAPMWRSNEMDPELWLLNETPGSIQAERMKLERYVSSYRQWDPAQLKYQPDPSSSREFVTEPFESVRALLVAGGPISSSGPLQSSAAVKSEE